MSVSQMEVFNKYVQPVLVDTLTQKIEQFNAASGGALVLSTEGFNGDFAQRSFFAGLGGSQRRVNRYGTNDDVAPIDLEQRKDAAVKVAGGFGPVRYEPSQMTWLQKPTAEGIEVISSEMADAILSDQINTLIAALVAGLGNEAGATNDVSADSGVDYQALNSSYALFGDSSSNIITDVMTGAMSHKLIGNNVANVERLFSADGVRIISIFGRTTVVTDAPALSDVVNSKDSVLSLVSGGGMVFDGGDVITNIQTSNGKNRIETTMQSDYTFGVSLKGYGWEGGKSPGDADLMTGTNWVKSMDSVKSTAGVLTIGAA